MARVELRRELEPDVRLAVHGLISDVQAATGTRPLSDHLWLDLIDGGDDLLAVLQWDGGRLEGYAQVSRTAETRVLEVVGRAGADRSELVRAALQAVGEHGGGEVHWWVFDSDDASAAIAVEQGLRALRTLYQMRVPLPVPYEGPRVETRHFVRGLDEDAWLEVNNAAFAPHPEQGGWDRETLHQREEQPWFDPEGFRMHERDGPR
jgi:mycothiol synthase